MHCACRIDCDSVKSTTIDSAARYIGYPSGKSFLLHILRDAYEYDDSGVHSIFAFLDLSIAGLLHARVRQIDRNDAFPRKSNDYSVLILTAEQFRFQMSGSTVWKSVANVHEPVCKQ